MIQSHTMWPPAPTPWLPACLPCPKMPPRATVSSSPVRWGPSRLKFPRLHWGRVWNYLCSVTETRLRCALRHDPCPCGQVWRRSLDLRIQKPWLTTTSQCGVTDHSVRSIKLKAISFIVSIKDGDAFAFLSSTFVCQGIKHKGLVATSGLQGFSHWNQ